MLFSLRRDRELSFMVTLGATLLLSPLLWDHYLALPAAAGGVPRRSAAGRWAWAAAARWLPRWLPSRRSLPLRSRIAGDRSLPFAGARRDRAASPDARSPIGSGAGCAHRRVVEARRPLAGAEPRLAASAPAGSSTTPAAPCDRQHEPGHGRRSGGTRPPRSSAAGRSGAPHEERIDGEAHEEHVDAA